MADASPPQHPLEYARKAPPPPREPGRRRASFAIAVTCGLISALAGGAFLIGLYMIYPWWPIQLDSILLFSLLALLSWIAAPVGTIAGAVFLNTSRNWDYYGLDDAKRRIVACALAGCVVGYMAIVWSLVGNFRL